MWHHYSNKKTSRILPKTAIDALSQCDKNFYPNIFILLKIYSTVPITSTTDRSFSTLWQIKTYMQNTTGQDQLNGLALLNTQGKLKSAQDMS
jgi:hypothetical protein